MLANSSRFSVTSVSPAPTLASSETSLRGSPAKLIVPRDGMAPMMALKSVVLPAPFAPITLTMAAVSSASETPVSASTRP